ncbi:MAG: hypothetical protein WBF90_32135 [Rivularia sp. (in: cyanobacteria)]
MIRELRGNLTANLDLKISDNLKRSIQDVARLEKKSVAKLVRGVLTNYVVNRK